MSKVYIFPYVGNLTNNYHKDGGVTVIALGRPSAERLIKQHAPHAELTEEDWTRATILDLADDVQEQAFIFPDAGCC